MVFEAALGEFTEGGRSYRRRYNNLLWAQISVCCFWQIQIPYSCTDCGTIFKVDCGGTILCCNWFSLGWKCVIAADMYFPEAE
jgi:hypothetical protein